VMIHRLDLAAADRAVALGRAAPTVLIQRQVAWTAIGLVLFVGVLYLVRNHRTLARYGYTAGFAGLVLLALPGLLPSSISEVNGARIWLRLGIFSIQPGEFAKILLIVFFSVFLMQKRELFSEAGRKFLGTFDRRTAIENEALDFFANGHPLIEGLVEELEDSARGRVGALRLARKHAPNLHGLYLLILEGRETIGRPRILPLMHASGVDLADLDMSAESDALYEAFDLGIELDEARVKALMGRVANQPMLTELDASQVVQAILVAVMD